MSCPDIPENWRPIGPQVFSCPCCGVDHPRRHERAPIVYAAHGAMVRVCPSCGVRAWSCPVCGNGPAVERGDERVCPCGFSGHIPCAERPANWKAPRPVEEVAAAQTIPVPMVASEPAPERETSAPTAVSKKRAPTQRKPRPQKSPDGQGSLF